MLGHTVNDGLLSKKGPSCGMVTVQHDQIILCAWYWVRTDRACGGVGVIDGVVRAACPYFRFMIGKRLTEIPQIRERHRI